MCYVRHDTAARPAPDVHCRQSLNLNPRCAVGATPHCVPLTSTHHLGHLTSSPRPLRHATTNPTNTPTIQSTPPYPTPHTPIPPVDALTGQAPNGCRQGNLTPALPTAPRRTTGPITLTSHRAHSPTVHNRIMDRSTAPQPTGDRFRLVPPMAALGMGDHPKAAHPTVDRPTADHPTGNRPMVDNHPPTVLPANFYIIIQQMLDSYYNYYKTSTANAAIIVLQFVSISQPSLYHL